MNEKPLCVCYVALEKDCAMVLLFLAFHPLVFSFRFISVTAVFTDFTTSWVFRKWNESKLCHDEADPTDVFTVHTVSYEKKVLFRWSAMLSIGHKTKSQQTYKDFIYFLVNGLMGWAIDDDEKFNGDC